MKIISNSIGIDEKGKKGEVKLNGEWLVGQINI